MQIDVGQGVQGASVKGHMDSKYAWVVLAAIFVASVAAPLNQFKVPPVMPALMDCFGLDMTTAGFLMSVFSLAGLMMAFPAGAVLSRLGQKMTCVLALLFLISGSLWGTYAETTSMLLLSRVVEGAGMAVLGVSAPVVIAAWFSPSRRGLPMGVWSAWVSTGVIVMMNASPLVTPAGKWTQTWWLGTILAVVALALFVLMYRNPPVSGNVPEAEEGGLPEKGGLKALFLEAVTIRDVWLISVALFSFNIMVLAMNTFFPTFLHQAHGLSMAQADFQSSIPNMVMLLSCPLGGWIADKTGRRKVVFAICLALMGLWWLVAFRAPESMVPVLMVAFGLFSGPVITTIIMSLPDAVKRPALLGFGMSLLMFWHHLGEFVGPIYFGEVLDMTGDWNLAGVIMVPVCLVGGACGWLMKTR